MLPDTEHVPLVTDQEMSPVVLPPVAASDNVSPYVAVVDVTVRVAWLAFVAVIANEVDVTDS